MLIIFCASKNARKPAVPPLDSVSGQIEKGLKESKAYELALQQAATASRAAQKRKGYCETRAGNNLKLEETGWFLRNAPQLPKIGELAESESRTGRRYRRKSLLPIRLYTQNDAPSFLRSKRAKAPIWSSSKRKRTISRNKRWPRAASGRWLNLWRAQSQSQDQSSIRLSRRE